MEIALRKIVEPLKRLNYFLFIIVACAHKLLIWRVYWNVQLEISSIFRKLHDTLQVYRRMERKHFLAALPELTQHDLSINSCK